MAREETARSLVDVFDQLENMPRDLEAEMACLGACMISQDALRVVRETLREPEDWYLPSNHRIFEAICALDDRNQRADVLTVAGELEWRQELQPATSAVGREYLTFCVDAVPSAARAGTYAARLRDLAILRRLLGAADTIKAVVFEPDGTLREKVDQAEQAVLSVGEQLQERQQATVTVKQVLHATMDMVREAQDGGGAAGITTGFAQLDALTSGWKPGELIVLCGRPSIGKTALALHFALVAAQKAGVPTVLFSLEMLQTEVGLRLFCADAKVHSIQILSGAVSPEQMLALYQSHGELSKLPFWVNDNSVMTVTDIRHECRRLAKQGLGLILIDYLQLVTWAGARGESQSYRVGEIVKACKAIGKELGCPVILISQLNRDAEKEGRSIRMSDLRDSGDIEQTAHVIAALEREGYQKDDPQFAEGERAALRLIKNRNGPIGTVKLTFLRKYGLFTERFEEEGMLAPPPERTYWEPERD